MKIGCSEVPKPTYPSLLWLAEWKAPAPLNTVGQLCSSKITIVDNNSNSNIGKINKTSKTLTGESTSCKWKARKWLEAIYQLTNNIYKGEQGEPFVFALLDSTAMLPCLAVVPTHSTLVSCSVSSFYVSKPTLNCCELLCVVLPLLDLFYRPNPLNPCELLSPLFWCQISSSLLSYKLHISPLFWGRSDILNPCHLLCVSFSTNLLMLFEHSELCWDFYSPFSPLLL